MPDRSHAETQAFLKTARERFEQAAKANRYHPRHGK
jgi:hypothetical protein